MSRQVNRSFWSMAADEPFRIFFPLGVLVGLSGVSLWPLFFSGIHHSFYPGVMHARLMIQGFMGAFIIGFLGTAAPRLTGAKSLSRAELSALIGLFVLAVGIHIAERYLVGDFVFLALLLSFSAMLVRRVRRRNELPPPTFVLVGFGFLNAIVGTVLLILGTTWTGGAPRAVILGNVLLYQGFVLSLVLGVGSFLFPRFLQLPERPLPSSPTPTPEWCNAARTAILAGVFLSVSFIAEVLTPWSRLATLLRFTTVAVFLFAQFPLRHSAPRVTLARVLKLSLLLLLLGLAFPVFWPIQRVAGLHLVFVGGFTLITFTIATRVVLGHSGQSHRFDSRMPFFIGATILLLISAALRVTGDFTVNVRGSLLSYASYLWMIAAVVWGWRVLPLVRTADQEVSGGR